MPTVIGAKSNGVRFSNETRSGKYANRVLDIYSSMVLSHAAIGLLGNIRNGIAGASSVIARQPAIRAITKSADVLPAGFTGTVSPYVKSGMFTGTLFTGFSLVNDYFLKGSASLDPMELASRFAVGFTGGMFLAKLAPAWMGNVQKTLGEMAVDNFSLLKSINAGMGLGLFNVAGGGHLMGIMQGTGLMKTVDEYAESFFSGFQMGAVLGPWFRLAVPAEAFAGELGRYARVLADDGGLGSRLEKMLGTNIAKFAETSIGLGKFHIAGMLGEKAGGFLDAQLGTEFFKDYLFL